MDGIRDSSGGNGSSKGGRRSLGWGRKLKEISRKVGKRKTRQSVYFHHHVVCALHPERQEGGGPVHCSWSRGLEKALLPTGPHLVAWTAGAHASEALGFPPAAPKPLFMQI